MACASSPISSRGPPDEQVDDSAMAVVCDTDAQQTEEKKCVVDCAIISDHYWPPLSSSTSSSSTSSSSSRGVSDLSALQHHPYISQQLKQYSDVYSKLKKPRSLTIMPQLGTIQLDIDFEDLSSRTFHVDPIRVI